MRKILLVALLIGVSACKKKALVVPAPAPAPTPAPVVKVPAAHEAPAVVLPKPRPKPAVVPPAVQTAPAPQLGEILTDARRRTVEADYKHSVDRANASLQKAVGRKLTATQGEAVQRIVTFLKQAESAKGQDVVEALQLARRAALLGDDLLKSLP